MPPLDDPPPLQRIFRLAVQACVTFSIAAGAADVAGKHAPPHQRALWFGLAGGTAALCVWLGWGYLLEKARRSQR